MSEEKMNAELSVSDIVNDGKVCGQSSFMDLGERLKSHYGYVSGISHEWSNQVSIAIDFYLENYHQIEQLKKERDTLLNILKDFRHTTECKRTWVDEMQGTIDAVLEEMKQG